MYMRIYGADTGQVVAEGDVSTSNSTVASRAVIERAVAAGYDVECEGKLYFDESPTGRNAHAVVYSAHCEQEDGHGNVCGAPANEQRDRLAGDDDDDEQYYLCDECARRYDAGEFDEPVADRAG